MFSANDKAMISGLKHILDNATFPLKKREVASFVQVMTWLVELEKRVENDLIPKQVIEKKKKVGLSK